MIGHTSLIDIRMQGFKPRTVFVYALDAALPYTRHMHPEHQIYLGGDPMVDVLPDEAVGALDFRCIAALNVHLQGVRAYRVMEVLDRLMEFNPSSVYAFAQDSGTLMHWTAASGFRELGAAK